MAVAVTGMSTLAGKIRGVGVSVLALALAGCAAAGSQSQDDGQSIASAAQPGQKGEAMASASENPSQLLWGDTHLHTEYSLDANIFGVKLGPDDAYRFAKGEAVTASNGVRAKLETPLDFLMVSDHSDYLGAMPELRAGNPMLTANPELRKWMDILRTHPERDEERLWLEARVTEPVNPTELDDDAMRASYWRKIVASAERHNNPGKFTAIIGFEWTAQNVGQNLHRVVMFRDGAEETNQILPISSKRDGDPRTLWNFMQGYEQKTGGKVLAVAHNGNLSNGAMFPMTETEFGKPMTAEYVRERARWEPVYEATQIKGDGETHPYLSPEDEFANYETWDRLDFAGVPKQNSMLAGEYARSALRRGLQMQKRWGTNPYKFGLIGSSDTHTALSAVDEDNFTGKHSAEMEPSSTRWKDAIGGRGEFMVPGWMMAASGYAAVWARNNTREEIWDAFRRREVYATTGPRIRLRFFGGWDFDSADLSTPNLADTGYAKGVPMGGDLKPKGGKAPSFLIQALRDPKGATLDRVQVVKGWMDASGETHEKVYNVAWSNPSARKLDAKGKLPMITGNVDVAKATYDNSVGTSQLVTAWRDPDFDPAQQAFYYVRVLQIPTPRWTAYDAARYGVTMSKQVPMITQDRAYSSPIWYNPS